MCAPAMRARAGSETIVKSLRLLLLTFSLAGCATPGGYDAGAASGYLIAANYNAADALIAIGKSQIDPHKPIIIATIVDIDDLEKSSTLGRFISESVSARFTQNGYRMVEMKIQNAVYMKRDEGELMLTRQIREIASSHQAQAVVVGTYSRARSAVLVNLKVVKPENNIVIAAYDYPLPMGKDVCIMIYRDPANCVEKKW